MKTTMCTLLCVLTSALGSFAAVLTVDNNANSAGQYTNLQTAINAASDGDTIYVSGSTANYGDATIRKRLTLFGTGYNPLKQQPLVSAVSTLYLDTLISVSGASGTVIAGFSMNGINHNYGAKNTRVERNHIYSTIGLNAGSANCIIRHNMFNGNISINNATSVLIENNIIHHNTIYYSNQPSVIISHNLFMGNIGTGLYSLFQISSATVINNIFWGASPLGNSVNSNVLNNNLTFQTPNDAIPGGSNSGSGNLVSTNPQFVNAPSPGISYSYDYNLAAASAANNAGTDGTDLGVYGGANTLPNLSGMPPIPQITEMNIGTPVIAPGSNLGVSFKAKKNN